MTLGATSNVAINTNKFTVNAATGNTLIAGTWQLKEGRNFIILLKIILINKSPTIQFKGTLTGEGATTLETTLGVTGAATITGNVVLGGTLTLGATSNVAINTDKFTVNAATGNTLIAGTLTGKGATILETTLGVTGATTITGSLTLGSSLLLGALSNFAINTVSIS